MEQSIIDQLQLEANRKSRKELQAYLKSQNKSATGTTVTLRRLYVETRRCCSGCNGSDGDGTAFMSPSATPRHSTSAATTTTTTTTATTKTTTTKNIQRVGDMKTPHAKAPPGEKRLKKYRPTCSRGVRDRIARARTQRLFLVEPPTPPTATTGVGNRGDSSRNCLRRECTVLGSTGNIYKVSIGHLMHCTCPDHLKGNVCKHILFVMLKVVGLPTTSPLVYQAALLSNELEDIFAILDQRMGRVGRGGGGDGGGVMANARVREAYQDMMSPTSKCPPTELCELNDNDNEAEITLTGTTRRPIEEEDCPICFDSLSPDGDQKKEQIVFCRAVCGYNFHKTCMTNWMTQSSTCPNCRADWLGDNNAASTSTRDGVVMSSPEGYTNLGRLQGQRTTRDTSTYSEWYGQNKRRRRF